MKRYLPPHTQILLAGILAFGEPISITVALGLICILASVYILR